jgi:hypothetical protein
MKKTTIKEARLKLPKYVSLNGTALKLEHTDDGNHYHYWRVAGLWGVDYKIIDGKLYSWHWRMGHDWLHRVELIPITEQEWRNDNRGYV